MKTFQPNPLIYNGNEIKNSPNPRSRVNGPSDPASPPADRPARKPRVLAIAPVASVRHEDAETPVIPEPQATRAIARSQFARIRTLVKYGMTVAQVAEVYGAAVGEIERILHKG